MIGRGQVGDFVILEKSELCELFWFRELLYKEVGDIVYAWKSLRYDAKGIYAQFLGCTSKTQFKREMEKKV